jgi:drug/metabolite transporter (DMT)-like permease
MQTRRKDRLGLAVGAILAACLALSLGDALIKRESAHFVLWQIFVMRSVLAIPLLIYFARLRSCQTPLRPLQAGWTLLRSLVLVLMWILYFASLPHIELATAAAGYYTLPLFIVLLAAIFLRESISARGWLALTFGLAGALLILRLRAEDFNVHALLPVAAALCYAAAMLLTRSKCRDERPLLLSLWLNVTFVIVGALALLALALLQPSAEAVALNPFLLGDWIQMELAQWRTMAVLACAILVGSVCAAIAYQNAPASTIAIFDFSYLGFAVAWGLIIFAELPGLLEACGMIAIFIAGTIAIRQRPPNRGTSGV